MLETVLGMFSSHLNRPLTVGSTAVALIAPGTLIIYLSRPELFSTLGVNGVVLLSIAISSPIVLICYSIWHNPMMMLRTAYDKTILKRPTSAPGLNPLDSIPAEDPLEWPGLLFGSTLTNITLYSIAAVAYLRPIRIGATFLIVAGVLAAVWLVVLVGVSILLKRTEPTTERVA